LPVELPAPELKHRIFFANQIINGVLVHMLLNDPGPVHLKSRSAIERLTALLTAHLTMPFAVPSPATDGPPQDDSQALSSSGIIIS